MNYLKGENAGKIFYLTASKRKALADNIIDNLIAFHRVNNAEGFGEINSDHPPTLGTLWGLHEKSQLHSGVLGGEGAQKPQTPNMTDPRTDLAVPPASLPRRPGDCSLHPE